MANDSSMLIEEMEKGNFLNEMIESNLEMDNLLLESDFALETAESELKATSKGEPPIISEEDDTSSALSIEVSEDLFKGFTSDINFTSPLRYTSGANKNTKPDSMKIPETLNNLLDDFNTSLKNYNTVFKKEQTLCKELDEINDKTISAEENNCLYIDLCNTTLEITVPNDINDNDDHEPQDTSTLKHYDHFEGCSPDFDSKNITNEFTVIVTENIAKSENNSSETVIKTYDDVASPGINFTVVDLNEIDENMAKSLDINNDFEPEFNDMPEKSEITNGGMIYSEINNYTVDLNKTDKHLTELINIQSEIISNIENILEIPEVITLSTSNTMDLASQLVQINAGLSDDHIFDENDKAMKITETLNENNNIVSQSSKRPGEEITPKESEVKKLKLDEKPATLSGKTSKLNEKPPTLPKETSETVQSNEVPDDAASLAVDSNFTQEIFDAEETADHNDPKWSVLKDLETNEDYFNSVRSQWPSISLPNPHKNITTRYVHNDIAKIKSHTITSSETERVISCDQFLDNRIKHISHEIKGVSSKMNSCFPRFRRSESNKITKDLEQLEKLQHEVEKNKEELKHINMFYYNDAQGWDANYLTQPEIKELQEQEKVLDFQKSFYKS